VIDWMRENALLVVTVVCIVIALAAYLTGTSLDVLPPGISSDNCRGRC
jgi:hypothetical protein